MALWRARRGERPKVLANHERRGKKGLMRLLIGKRCLAFMGGWALALSGGVAAAAAAVTGGGARGPYMGKGIGEYVYQSNINCS